MFQKELEEKYPEIIKFLTNAITKSKLANSYVFIGKDTNDFLLIVKNLAKILNCKKNKNIYSLPCNECINCKWLDKNEHPQALKVVGVESTSKKEQIKIEAIRELLNSLNTTSDFFRVVFFERASTVTLPAECCNLLLKPIEETPEKTIFIFANNTRQDILPTIMSRSQLLYLNKKLNYADELFNGVFLEIPETFIPTPFSRLTRTTIDKANQTQKYIQENEIKLKNYLLSLAKGTYQNEKYNNPTNFSRFYKKLQLANLKLNSFMQSKIVLEDLFLDTI